jgi:hypothetical protein
MGGVVKGALAIVADPPIHESPKVCLSQGPLYIYIYSHLHLVIIFLKNVSVLY